MVLDSIFVHKSTKSKQAIWKYKRKKWTAVTNLTWFFGKFSFFLYYGSMGAFIQIVIHSTATKAREKAKQKRKNNNNVNGEYKCQTMSPSAADNKVANIISC